MQTFGLQVSTTCQMSILLPQLEAEQNAALCVVNTHLFFHPLAAHLRTVMTAAIIVEALHAVDSHVSTQLEQQDAVMRPALLFCGDLNSDLNDGMPGASPVPDAVPFETTHIMFNIDQHCPVFHIVRMPIEGGSRCM